ncbi:MAG: hypothetical protein ACOC0B_01450 [bacterium]
MAQHTIRTVSSPIDWSLRDEARKSGKSLNEVAVDRLRCGLGLSEDVPRYDDLDDLIGSWVADPAVDRALEEQDCIDPELWN